jgi:hypothetical protein
VNWAQQLIGAKPFPAAVAPKRERRTGPVLVCSCCREIKDAEMFRLNRYQTRESWCKDCLRIRKRQWWRVNRSQEALQKKA